MKPRRLSSRRLRAFTLIELLVVMAIMALLIALSTLGVRSLNSAGKFDKAISDISGTLELARSYAIAQNTYVWVVLYENVPSNNGPLEVYVGSFASNDGTDFLNWTGSQTVPSPGLTPLARLAHFKGLHLQTTTLPKVSSNPSFPATIPSFQCTGQSDLGPVTLSDASPVYWVIQFTPTGAARNGPTPVESIWLGVQPSLSQAVQDMHNPASLKVNGFTGLTTIYRP
ncbi:MAG: prepilin-type N-terminal cleavage/methylation domain-containing protein [Chthoniobacteraceae bacterium]|nr:prepilin-type N-terminal cleavage/methylation domain-containing protein [Chthoniobacteraceae bacterium]